MKKKHKTFIAIVSVFIVGCNSGCATLFGEKQYAAFKSSLEKSKAKEYTVTPAESYYAKGDSKFSSDDYTGAIKAYSKVIELDPKYPNVYYSRGLSKFLLADYKGAIEDFNKAVEIDSKDTSAASKRDECIKLANKETLESTIKDLTKTIELEPKNTQAYYSRGLIKDKLQDYRGTIEDYGKAIELDPENELFSSKRDEFTINMAEAIKTKVPSSIDLTDAEAKKVITDAEAIVKRKKDEEKERLKTAAEEKKKEKEEATEKTKKADAMAKECEAIKAAFHICDATYMLSLSQEEINHQKKIGAVSGYVDKQALYQAGRQIVSGRQVLAEWKDEYKRLTGKNFNTALCPKYLEANGNQGHELNKKRLEVCGKNNFW